MMKMTRRAAVAIPFTPLLAPLAPLVQRIPYVNGAWMVSVRSLGRWGSASVFKTLRCDLHLADYGIRDVVHTSYYLRSGLQWNRVSLTQALKQYRIGSDPFLQLAFKNPKHPIPDTIADSFVQGTLRVVTGK